jgi:hypothetical protein
MELGVWQRDFNRQASKVRPSRPNAGCKSTKEMDSSLTGMREKTCSDSHWTIKGQHSFLESPSTGDSLDRRARIRVGSNFLPSSSSRKRPAQSFYWRTISLDRTLCTFSLSGTRSRVVQPDAFGPQSVQRQYGQYASGARSARGSGRENVQGSPIQHAALPEELSLVSPA